MLALYPARSIAGQSCSWRKVGRVDSEIEAECGADQTRRFHRLPGHVSNQVGILDLEKSQRKLSSETWTFVMKKLPVIPGDVYIAALTWVLSTSLKQCNASSNFNAVALTALIYSIEIKRQTKLAKFHNNSHSIASF